MRGVIIILAFVLGGCAWWQDPAEWTKPGAYSNDLAVDLHVCGQWSRLAEDPHDVYEPYLRRCMALHGWRETASAP